jgi:SAM-dependent methyltransferase
MHDEIEGGRLEFTGERLVLEPATAWFWDRIALEHVSRYLFARALLRGRRVLDAACGTGYGAALLAGEARTVLGVDIDPASIRFAKARWRMPAVDFVGGSVEQLPLADDSFDTVVSFETIEHVDDPATFVSECARVLTPGGRLVISTPWREVYNSVSFAHGEGNPFHHSEMSPEEFRTVLSDRFAIESMYGQVPAHGFGRTTPPTRGRFALPHKARELAKTVVVAATSRILSQPRLGRRAISILRPAFWPRPFDDRPYKYLIAVCTRR